MRVLVAGLDGDRAVPPPWATDRRHVHFRIYKSTFYLLTYLLKMIATSGFISRSFRVHQIRVRPGLCPGPRSGAYSDTIRYDTRCYFNVRSKADMSRLNLPHGDDN